MMAFADDLLVEFRARGVRQEAISNLCVRLCDDCVAEISGRLSATRELWRAISDKPISVMGYSATEKVVQQEIVGRSLDGTGTHNYNTPSASSQYNLEDSTHRDS